jgi:pantoate--beta-alanine ligase
MNIFYNKSDLRLFLSGFRKGNLTVGFVPTMGALHEGHLSLVDYSVKQNDITVVSVFVNPTQFNNLDDLKMYPRNLEKDIASLAQFSKEIVLYSPNASDVYDDGFDLKHNYDLQGLDSVLEGEFRPGHFEGVVNVVERLFKIVEPTNAYFGEKDFQQLQVIKCFVSQSNLNVNVVSCPILREKSGLAMSSRNERLTVEEREDAKLIFEVLNEFKRSFNKVAVTDIYSFVKDKFDSNARFDLEYFNISEESSLVKIKELKENEKYRAFIAVFAGDVRLIDNIMLN